jgi:hypothetical protein
MGLIVARRNFRWLNRSEHFLGKFRSSRSQPGRSLRARLGIADCKKMCVDGLPFAQDDRRTSIRRPRWRRPEASCRHARTILGPWTAAVQPASAPLGTASIPSCIWPRRRIYYTSVTSRIFGKLSSAPPRRPIRRSATLRADLALAIGPCRTPRSRPPSSRPDFCPPKRVHGKNSNHFRHCDLRRAALTYVRHEGKNSSSRRRIASSVRLTRCDRRPRRNSRYRRLLSAPR